MEEAKKRDNDLARRAVEGDKDAFGKLFETYASPVYRFVYFRVGSRETAEDIASQTFEKALKGLNGFDGKNSFKTWLFTIARNTVIDYYRSRKNIFSIDELEDVFPGADDLMKETEVGDDAKRLLKGLDKLKNEWKRIVEYKYIFELDNDEIAYMTGLTKGNIRVILTRAVKKLKQLFRSEK